MSSAAFSLSAPRSCSTLCELVSHRLRLSQQNKEKDESEKERDKDEEKTPKPTGVKRGRPQIRTTPTGSAGRSVSKTPSNEGRSNGRRTETPSNMANGDSKIH